MTDQEFQHILDSLPPKSPRSRLEPYGGLIYKLRRRGRTYREIVGILAKECGLRVSVSTLHDFIRGRSMQERKQKEREGADLSRRDGVIQIPTVKPMEQDSPPPDRIQERISYLRRHLTPAEQTPESFHYDSDEPLRLPPSREKTVRAETCSPPSKRDSRKSAIRDKRDGVVVFETDFSKRHSRILLRLLRRELRAGLHQSDACVAIEVPYRQRNPEDNPLWSPDIWKPFWPANAKAIAMFLACRD